MENDNVDPNPSDFLRGFLKGQLLSTVIFLAVSALIWGALSSFLPNGWWHAVINIGAFLITLAGASAIKTTLTMLSAPGWLSFLGAIVVWFVVVVVLRSIEMEIIDSVF